MYIHKDYESLHQRIHINKRYKYTVNDNVIVLRIILIENVSITILVFDIIIQS